MPNTFWWLLNFERYVHVYLSFRCIFLICSCHLNNHPSILWTILYPSPDDGYYNRNVNVDFTSWYIHLFGLYFFLLPSYCRILSIFTFIYIYIYIYNLINRITMIRKSSKHCIWHTKALDSSFNLIRSHQQCISWSLLLEVEPAITECRAKTLPLTISPHSTQAIPN